MPPLPKHPATRSRGRKSTTAATLRPVDDPTIPPLPPAAEWIDADSWPSPVTAWWTATWSSPMSSEFDKSDIPQLHLGAAYLAMAVDSNLKASERLAAGRQHEACIKNFGLSPMSRRSLQWEIAKAEGAQDRASRRGGKPPAASTAKQHRPDPRDAEEDTSNPFTAKRLEREAGR